MSMENYRWVSKIHVGDSEPDIAKEGTEQIS